MSPEAMGAAPRVIEAARLLYERGLVNAYEGNVSARIGDSMLITPSQVCKAELTPEDLVELRIDTGEVLRARNGRRASSEWRMHRRCYLSRGDIRAVAHAHPPYATAHALRGEPIESAAYPEMIILYGRVPVCGYGRPGTEAVSDGVPSALAGGDVFLLANHGLTAVGDAPLEAAYRLESVESIARTLEIARAKGGEAPLPEAEVRALYEIRDAIRRGPDEGRS